MTETKSEYTVYKSDADYPERLRTIPHSPSKLYVRGELPDNDKPSVAIIGARDCSSYGRDMAKWFGIELARAGVQIISGMARGIDGISQSAALKAGGKSFAVLGCGIDVCYPTENRYIYDALFDCGGIISEFPPGTQPLARNFPSRNRIISGLADIILVVEAREKSGTLITVDYALSQGKDVFAIPGRLGDQRSAGCNALIHMGAFMALSPGDILEALGIGERARVLSLDYALQYVKNRGVTGSRDDTMRESLRCGVSEIEKMKRKRSDIFPGSGKEAPPGLFCKLSEAELSIWNILGDEPESIQNIYEAISLKQDMALQEVINILMNMVLKKVVIAERSTYKRAPGVLPE